MTLRSASSRYETFRNGRTPARYGLVAGSNEKSGESKRASSSICTPQFSNYELSRREGDATSVLTLRSNDGLLNKIRRTRDCLHDLVPRSREHVGAGKADAADAHRRHQRPILSTRAYRPKPQGWPPAPTA